MHEQAWVFACKGEPLLGVLHGVAAAAQLGVVVVVGGPQYRVGSHRQFVLLARALAGAGYPVLRFDYRGMGDSGGAALGFEGVDADIRAAIDALLQAQPTLQGVVLWGLCDAASACLMYCNQGDARVQGLILANPWVRTVAGEASAYLKYYYVQRLLQKSFWSKLFSGAFNVRRSLQELLGTVRQVRHAAAVQGDDASAHTGHFIERMLTGLQRFANPILLLNSERDLTAKEFFDFVGKHADWQACLKRDSVQVQDCRGADHTFSTHADLARANACCIQWLKRLPACSR